MSGAPLAINNSCDSYCINDFIKISNAFESWYNYRQSSVEEFVMKKIAVDATVYDYLGIDRISLKK